MSAEPARLGTDALSPFWIYTGSGSCFDYENPRPEMIDRRDLAMRLTREGRWAHNTWWHLSVAQHSLLVANAIAEPGWRVYGLLHDAAEAFVRDLPTPFKLWLAKEGADVSGLEHRILNLAIYPHFDLPPPSHEIAQAVDIADARALATEFRDVVKGKGEAWRPRAEPFPQPVVNRPRLDWEDQFLRALDNMIRDAHRAGLRRAA